MNRRTLCERAVTARQPISTEHLPVVLAAGIFALCGLVGTVGLGTVAAVDFAASRQSVENTWAACAENTGGRSSHTVAAGAVAYLNSVDAELLMISPDSASIPHDAALEKTLVDGFRSNLEAGTPGEVMMLGGGADYPSLERESVEAQTNIGRVEPCGSLAPLPLPLP